MNYRDFCGESCSLLGFGTMRFPRTKEGGIDEARAEAMLDTAYRAGVNYFDTAYPYHDKQSEPFVGRVLAKYPRESWHIATKLPMWAISSAEEAKQMFAHQLERLGVDYVDYYLFHALSGATFREKVQGFGLIPIFRELQREGKIRHLGFSFHDSYAAFEEILTAEPWDFCQIQYNYMDTRENPGDRGYALAERLGIPLVIMEPIRGGSLAAFPEDICARFASLDPARSMANVALSWCATHPNVKVILSGMSNEEHVAGNLDTLGDGFRPFTDGEMQEIATIADEIRARVYNACTGCRYCMPCPGGVDIPRTFYHMNETAMYGNLARYRAGYLKGDALASRCISCGACEALCPQHIGIRDDLRRAVALFEQAE